MCFGFPFGAELGKVNGADLVRPAQPPTPSGHEWTPGVGDDRQAGQGVRVSGLAGCLQLGVEGRLGDRHAQSSPHR